MPQAVWNGTHWVDYLYSRDEAKKCYVVKTGLISGEVYDSGVAKFWDVNMTEEHVKSEVWELWDAVANKKATLNTPITFSVVQNSSGVYVNATRTTSKPSGVLTVLYCFNVGSPLKHYVYWKSSETTNYTVAVKQVWDLAGFITKCQVDGVDKDSGTYNATQFLFYNETNPFLVFEDQSAMFEKLQPTSIDFAGKKVIFTFGNWTLAGGEALTVDPDTWTDPTQYAKESAWVWAYITGHTVSPSAGNIIKRLQIEMWIYTSGSSTYSYGSIRHQVNGGSEVEIAYGSGYGTEWVKVENTADETYPASANITFNFYIMGSTSNWVYGKDCYIEWEEIVHPTIGEFQAPSTVYANKYFFLNATINDADGIADFVNATIEINGTIVLLWVNSTNTFSEYSDTNNYCTLDTANSIKANLNTTAHKLSWKIKLYWNYTEGSIFVISTNTKCFDSAGASGSATTTSLFTFEDDLIIHTDATVSDSRVNPSQSITFTASIYYYGTSTAPEDVTGITGRVELAGVLKGSDTDVTGGLSITINAESTVANYSYNIYAYTDENSVTNRTVYVVVDRGVITISANTTSPAPSANVSFTLTAIYDFDDAPITSWTVNTLRSSTYFATGNFTDGGYDDTIYIYTVENFTETVYGLTAFTSNTLTVYWSTYVALTVKTVDLDSEILSDAIVDFNGTEVAVDSDGLAVKTGIAKYDNITVKVKWQGCYVNGSWTINMTETKTIEASCNVWSLTINAKDDDGTMLSLSPTNFIWTFPNSTEINYTRTDGSWTFKIMNGTHYYKIQYQGQWISENVTLPVDNKNVTVVNKNCWVYSLTVYVTDVNNVEKSGAELSLSRSDNVTLSDYGLTPKTAGYYNTTHARYVWSQLANQTSSYTVTATSGGQSASTTTALTANTEATVTLPAGSGSPSGGWTPPPVEQPPAYIPPVELPKVPGVEFNYGIVVLIGVVGVAATVAVVGRGKPSLETQWKKKTRITGFSSGKWKKTKHTDLSGKWRKKTKRK
jgi:hypothetical protein